MAMSLRKTSNSFINKLGYGLIAPASSFPSTISVSRAVRSFITQVPLPPPPPPPPAPYMIESPYMKGVRRGYGVNEDEWYTYFRIDLPGFSKEDLNSYVEKKNIKTPFLSGNVTHILNIVGEKENELGEKVMINKWELGVRKFGFVYTFDPFWYKTDEIMWVINNGVLRVLLPTTVRKDKPCCISDTTQMGPFMRENPFMLGERREWYAKKEEGTGLALRIDMPGLTQHHVKVFLEEDGKTLVIEGQGDKESKYEGFGRRCTRCKLDLTNFSKTERRTSVENGSSYLPFRQNRWSTKCPTFDWN